MIISDLAANCTSALANLPTEGRAGAATAARAAPPTPFLGFTSFSCSGSLIFFFFLLLFFVVVVSHSVEDDLLEDEEDREDAPFCEPTCKNLHDPFCSMNLHGLPAL